MSIIWCDKDLFGQATLIWSHVSG